MAFSVKLNVDTSGNRRVIVRSAGGTKVIACECCAQIPAECCMYPAAGLGVLYQQADLPVSFSIVSTAYDYVVPLSLTDNSNIYEGIAPGTTSQPARHTVGSVGVNVWELEGQSLITGEWYGAQDWAPQNCLFYNYASDINDEWPYEQPANTAFPVDEFSDTYEATCTTTIGGQTIQTTRTYTREDLCVWRSRNQSGDVDGELYYRTLASAEEAERFGMGRILWSLGGAGFRSPNDGPYNSPAGRYGPNGQCVVTEA